ncbi:MAG: N-acetylmuramoyl-L-alanine amidase [Lachnospiraceae bacterium]|nr:N-acetylmuramoyl-L-alanine amidase [Lachnospiraceae bacterium]
MQGKKLLFYGLLAIALLSAFFYYNRLKSERNASDMDGTVTDSSNEISENVVEVSENAIEVSENVVKIEATTYTQLLEQVHTAILENDIEFLEQKLLYKNGENNYKPYQEAQLKNFVRYMQENEKMLQSFMSQLSEGASYSAKADGKFIVALPVISFEITTDMEETLIKIQDFDDMVIGKQDLLTRGPLLPMEYSVVATNSNWEEQKSKKINVDLTNITIEVAFDSGAQAVHTGGHIVAIDPGHQGTGDSTQEPIGPGAATTKPKVASGTSGVSSGLREFELTLAVGMKLKQELISRGYEVVMIRESNDVNISNAGRAEIANASGAEAFIRIHANGANDSSVSGALSMAPSAANPYCSTIAASSQLLSKKVIDAFCAKTGAKNRGVSITDSMSGINWCQIPVTIVEMGFMTNPTEDLLMATEDYQKSMVIGMADGIDQYFGNVQP